MSLHDKVADAVTDVYPKEVYWCSVGSNEILTDNGNKLKNKLFFSEVTSQLGIKHIFPSPYRPQVNGIIESFYKFLKNFICKFTLKEILNEMV